MYEVCGARMRINATIKTRRMRLPYLPMFSKLAAFSGSANSIGRLLLGVGVPLRGYIVSMDDRDHSARRKKVETEDKDQIGAKDVRCIFVNTLVSV
jgi:hypothetical protein